MQQNAFIVLQSNSFTIWRWWIV